MPETAADLSEKFGQLEARMRDVEKVSANVKLVGIIISIVFGVLLAASLTGIGYLIFTLGELKEAKTNATGMFKDAKDRHEADTIRLEKTLADNAGRLEKILAENAARSEKSLAENVARLEKTLDKLDARLVKAEAPTLTKTSYPNGQNRYHEHTGKFGRLDSGTIIIDDSAVTDGFKTELTFKVANDARVLIKGAGAKLEDLKVGMFVALVHVAGKRGR